MEYTGEVTEICFQLRKYRVEADSRQEALEKLKAGETLSEMDLPDPDNGVRNRVIHTCEGEPC